MTPSLPFSETASQSLWERVPPVCSPHLSRLGPSLVSSHLLAVEAARQEKLRRKLERQLEVGAITEQQKQAQLDRVDRETAAGRANKDWKYFWHL